MKVLMVTDKMHLGGAETHVATLVESLILRGVCVTLLSGGGIYAERLEKLGATCVFAPLDKRDPISVVKCARIFKREMNSADLVHTHTRFTSKLASALRGESHYPPIVTTAHLNFPTFPYGPLSFYGDRTLAVSEDIKDFLMKKYSLNESRITVTRNSIDANLFGGERRIKKLIVHTSRIDNGRSKCAFALVSSAKTLLREFPEHKILIIGDGDCFKRLRAEAEEVNAKLGTTGILLAGKCDDVPSLLKYAEVFVGVSRAALEAMAFGIPTVIAGDEGYGGIASPQSFDRLASTNFCARGERALKRSELISDLRLLLSSPTQRETASIYCKERVLKDYTPSAMANDALRVYRSVLAQPRVCLVGYFGYGNLGDEESLKMAVTLLRAFGIKSISVLTRDGEGTNVGGVCVYDRMNPYDISEAIRRCDVLILAGGNLLQNETSSRSLHYYTAIVRHARNAGKRIYALSSGIGALSGSGAISEVKKCLSSFCALGLRTSADLKTAREMAAYRNSLAMPDLCFLEKEEKMACNPTRFAIILSESTEFTLGEIALITKARSLIPELISLFPERDKESISKLSSAGMICRTPRSASELAAILRPCAFSITERLHGAIFSVISHTPTYIRRNRGKSAHLLAEFEARSKKLNTNPIALPYSIDSVKKKKEVGVRDSDFISIISDMRSDIERSAIAMFGATLTLPSDALS